MGDIIKNTIREFFRLKIIYIGLFVGIVLIFSSYLLDTLTINQGNKAIIDFSLSVIEIFALILTLFLGSYLLYNEFNKKTVLLVLSRIKDKYKFIIGKFIGFSIILLFLYIILGFGFYLALLFHHISFEGFYIQAMFLSYMKILVVLAFVIFFSTFVSPFLALLSSLFIYFVAHMSAFMLFFAQIDQEKTISPFVKILLKGIYYVLPNFQDLSMKEYFLSPQLGNYTTTHFMLSATGGALVYIFILLVLSSLIFNKKEF